MALIVIAPGEPDTVIVWMRQNELKPPGCSVTRVVTVWLPVLVAEIVTEVSHVSIVIVMISPLDGVKLGVVIAAVPCAEVLTK